MSEERLDDGRAIELLDLLRDYVLDALDRGDTITTRELTVSELAGDLIDSLPRGLLTNSYVILDPDAITAGSHYRTT